MAKLWQTLNSRKIQQVFEPFGRGWHKMDFSFILLGLATSSALRTLCFEKNVQRYLKKCRQIVESSRRVEAGIMSQGPQQNE